MAAVLAVARHPATGIGILLAVDTIPDMFRTTANVTGWLCISRKKLRPRRISLILVNEGHRGGGESSACGLLSDEMPKILL
jgi:hypothetical protein